MDLKIVTKCEAHRSRVEIDNKRLCMCPRMITRAYVWVHVCPRDTSPRVSALRICICNRYAMAEIACYDWVLPLSGAGWTGPWTRGHAQGGGHARFLGQGGGMGGFRPPYMRSGARIFPSDFRTGCPKAQEDPSGELRVY
jgi:hypothetical protein